MAQRKRRTTPGDAAVLDYTPDPSSMSGLDETELDNRDDPRRKLSFFDYLAALTELECNERLLYIYRLEPSIRNPSGSGSYIEKVGPPIDEDYITQRHGGGKYLLWLKTTEKPARTDRKFTFSVAGAPRIPEGTTIIDANTGRPMQHTSTAPAGDSGQSGPMKEVLQMLGRLIDDRDRPSDLNAEILKKTLLDAHDIMASSVKKNAGSMTGNPLLDSLMQKMLDNLASPPKQADPLEQLKAQMDIMKSLRDLTGGEERRPRGDDFVERAKGIAELLKGDTDGSLRGLIFGHEDREVPGLGGSLLKITEAIITRRPDIIDSAATFLGRVAAGTGAASRPEMLPPSTLGGQSPQEAQPTAQTNQPPAAIDGRPQSREDVLINGLLGVVVNGFNGGHSGAVVAHSMRVTHPAETESFVQYLKLPDAAIIGWLRSQPVIAPIMAQPSFAEFYEEFKAELLYPTPIDAGDEEESQTL